MSLRLWRNSTSISHATVVDIDEISITVNTSPMSIGTNRCPVTLQLPVSFASGYGHPIYKYNVDTEQTVNITNADGSYNSGTGILNDGEQWELNGTLQSTFTYTLRMYSDGVNYQNRTSGSTSSRSWDYTLLNADVPTGQTGYRFKGWSDTSGSSTVAYEVGDTVSFVSTTTTQTIYAVWEQIAEKEYRFNYNLNGGNNWASGGTGTHYDTETSTASSISYTIPSTNYYTPVKSGYTFDGWATSPTGSAVYQAGSTYSFTSTSSITNFNLYAHYTETPVPTYTYTVKLYSQNVNYADRVSQPTIARTYEYQLLDSDAPSARSGYIFKGWDSDASADTVVYQVGDSVEFDYQGVLTQSIYAVWEEIPSVSKFYWDGVDGTTDSTLIATGTNVSNITDTRWNSLQIKIKAVDNNYVTQTVVAGQNITANLINHTLAGLRTILTAHSLSITIPSDVTAGDSITASIFNGINDNVYSMKDALNYIVDNI